MSRLGMLGAGVLLGGTLAQGWGWGVSGWVAFALVLVAIFLDRRSR